MARVVKVGKLHRVQESKHVCMICLFDNPNLFLCHPLHSLSYQIQKLQEWNEQERQGRKEL